jgi:predicted transcriptional regulator
MGVKKVTKPKATIDPLILEECARAGFTVAEIALHMGIDPSTIYRHKREKPELQDAIKKGKLQAHAEVSNNLYDQCKKGNVAAIIWYEKTRRGLSDRVNISVTEIDNAIERELARLAGGSEAGTTEEVTAETVH